jgi:hypothetical protein
MEMLFMVLIQMDQKTDSVAHFFAITPIQHRQR